MSTRTGKVKWFKPEKGFGFITQENGADLFFHFRSLKMEGFKTIETGQSVQFTPVKSAKGLEAIDVSIISDISQ